MASFRGGFDGHHTPRGTTRGGGGASDLNGTVGVWNLPDVRVCDFTVRWQALWREHCRPRVETMASSWIIAKCQLVTSPILPAVRNPSRQTFRAFVPYAGSIR